MQQKAASLESEVAERKEAEGRLQASETRYRRLLETASDGIVILDPETRKVIDVNTSMTSLLGLAREEILGKEIWETGLFEDRSAAQEVLRELDEAHFSRREQSIPGAGGGQRLELEIVSSLYRVNGRQVIQCNVRGIAERKLVEARLREQAELIETIYRTGQALSAELNLQKVVQVVTDAATELIGARFGSFLYNVTDQDGESYLLYPLSGLRGIRSPICPCRGKRTCSARHLEASRSSALPM